MTKPECKATRRGSRHLATDLSVTAPSNLPWGGTHVGSAFFAENVLHHLPETLDFARFSYDSFVAQGSHGHQGTTTSVTCRWSTVFWTHRCENDALPVPTLPGVHRMWSQPSLGLGRRGARSQRKPLVYLAAPYLRVAARSADIAASWGPQVLQ
jgi:hypothetical protein